jgi:thymidine phosphorylase
MLAAVGFQDRDPADVLAGGQAMDTWRALVRAQGGDPDADLPRARETEVVRAETDGVLQSVDALAVGVAAWRRGAGRARKDDQVQAGAGVQLHAKPGDRVFVGQPLLTLHTDTADRISSALAALCGSYRIDTAAPVGVPLVLDRIS